MTGAHPSPLAPSVGGVELLLEVVELLGVGRVGGVGTGTSHDGGVLVVAVPRQAGRRQGLGGVRSAGAS